MLPYLRAGLRVAGLGHLLDALEELKTKDPNLERMFRRAAESLDGNPEFRSINLQDQTSCLIFLVNALSSDTPKIYSVVQRGKSLARWIGDEFPEGKRELGDTWNYAIPLVSSVESQLRDLVQGSTPEDQGQIRLAVETVENTGQIRTDVRKLLEHYSKRDSSSWMYEGAAQGGMGIVVPSYSGDKEKRLPLIFPHKATPRLNPSPSQLLIARYSPVPFVGRAGSRERLDQWLNSSSQVSVAVIGGRGGSGKTRLAVELCRATPHRIVGFLAHGAKTEQIEQLANLDHSCLIVVDYAETRIASVADLLETVAYDRPSESGRTRVLLLVRNPENYQASESSQAGSQNRWKDAVRPRDLSAAAYELLEDATCLVLEKNPLDSDERNDLFMKAIAEFAEPLDDESPAASPASLTASDMARDERRYSDPLSVLIAAFLTVRGTAPEDKTLKSLYNEIIMHEHTYWSRIAETGRYKLELTPDEREAAVALATLTNYRTPDEAEQLLRAVPMLSGETITHRPRIRQWLDHLYRPNLTDEDINFSQSDGYWFPLEPDRLGEHLVIRALLKDSSTLETYRPLFETVLEKSRDASLLVRPVETLARIWEQLGQESSQGLGAILSDCYLGLVDTANAQTHEPLMRPDVENKENGLLFDGLHALTNAAFRDIKLHILKECQDRLDRGNLLAHRFALLLSSCVVDRSRASFASDPTRLEELADALDAHSQRLYEDRDIAGAIEYSLEAVDRWRNVVAEDFSRIKKLVVSYRELAHYLWIGERPWEAQTAANASIAEWEKVEDDSVEWMTCQAGNLGTRARVSQSWQFAEQMTAEAVRLRRRVVAEEPEVLEYRSELASALNYHVGFLISGPWKEGSPGIPTETSRHAIALKFANEAMDIWQQLAEKESRYRPAYARALANHARRMNQLGIKMNQLALKRTALAASALAVETARGLDQNDVTHIPVIAGVLEKHAKILIECAKFDPDRPANMLRTEALDFAQQAVDEWDRVPGQQRGHDLGLSGALLTYLKLKTSRRRTASKDAEQLQQDLVLADYIVSLRAKLPLTLRENRLQLVEATQLYATLLRRAGSYDAVIDISQDIIQHLEILAQTDPKYRGMLADAKRRREEVICEYEGSWSRSLHRLSRLDSNVSPAKTQSRTLSAEMSELFAETRRVVESLKKPTPLAAVAQSIISVFGRSITDDWGGFTSFGRFLREAVPEADIRTQPPPGYVYPSSSQL
ncbi:MAG: hypothetical protein FWD18_04730 [Micrococcales bacterium]|nr:hypothetical protein [Micrococcales bacterium]